ncbi:MAG: alkaline phosphatase family protein [Myxococcales bacterium]|nr:alkaline phosphatase family protein [Myxococcales bacterium]
MRTSTRRSALRQASQPQPQRLSRMLAVGLLLSAATACGGNQAPAPATTEAASAAPAARLVSGPMLGFVTMREATVWVATDGPATVSVEYWEVGASGLPLETAGPLRQTPPRATESSVDDTHLVHVADLEPGSEYGYRVVVDGERYDPPAGATLRTQPNWRWQTTPPVPPDLRIAFGSCNYVNEAAYDRAGTPYGGEHQIFDAIADQEPDFFVWLGDNVYFREVDWQSRSGMLHRYTHDRAIPELVRLLATTPQYATWDDHDFGANDSDRSYELQGEALELFREFWANPSYGLPSVPGVFTRFTWGDVEVFMVDDRMYRAPDGTPDDEPKPFLGDAQLQWLIDSLTSSTATFKLVAVGNQVLNTLSPYESYGAYAEERDRLLDAIARRRIDGVVFLTGDRHYTELLRVEREGTYPLYDFTSSPLTSGAGGPAASEADSPIRVPGTVVERTRSFGTVEVTGPWGARVLELRAWDSSGGELWSHRIEQSELATPPVTQ